MDAGVPAEAAVRGHEVGRIPGEEDPAHAVAAGYVGSRPPASQAVDADGELGEARPDPDQLDQPALARIRSRVRGARHGRVPQGVDDEEARAAALVEAEEAAEGRVVDVDHAHRLALELLTEVGREVDRDAVGEHAAPVEGDSQLLTDRAVRAVGGHEVGAAQRHLLSGVHIPRGQPDALVVLVGAHHLVTGQDARAGLQGAGLEDGLEAWLGDEEATARAHLVDPLVEAGDDVGQLAPGQAVHHHDGALGQELPLRLRPDLVLDAGLAEQLERAQVEVRGPRQSRPAPEPLHGQRAHAVLREEHRRRQAHEPSARDQHGRAGRARCALR